MTLLLPPAHEAAPEFAATDCGEHNGPEVRGETTHCEVCGIRVWH